MLTAVLSLHLRIQQFLRPRRVHVGLGDEIGAGVDIGGDLLAFRGRERGLDAVVAHAERVLHDEAGDDAVLQEFTSLSSESKPISLILSATLFSAIAWPAPCAMIRLEAKTPRRFGLAVIRSVMMLRPVVAWPSATLSATSFRPGYFAASSSLKPLARWSSEPTPGSEVISAMSPSALPYFSLIASARPSAATRPPWTLSVVRKEVKALESAAESMPMILTYLAASSIGLPSACELRRRDHNGGRLFRDGVLEDRDLAVDVGFGLGAELGHIDVQILAGFAGAGKHDLPVDGGRVLDDNRDGRFGSAAGTVWTVPAKVIAAQTNRAQSAGLRTN